MITKKSPLKKNRMNLWNSSLKLVNNAEGRQIQITFQSWRDLHGTNLVSVDLNQVKFLHLNKWAVSFHDWQWINGGPHVAPIAETRQKKPSYKIKEWHSWRQVTYGTYVMRKVSLQYPIVTSFGHYICDLVRKNRQKTSCVEMRCRLCNELEIDVTNVAHRRKGSYISRLNQLVNGCSCSI